MLRALMEPCSVSKILQNSTNCIVYILSLLVKQTTNSDYTDSNCLDHLCVSIAQYTEKKGVHWVELKPGSICMQYYV